MKYRSLFVVLEVAFCACFTTLNYAHAQGTAFTYQGRLSSNGAAANGNFDLQFGLYPVSTGGSIVGSLLTNAPVAVSNGLFTTTLDFGNVFNTSPLFLEIGVRTNGNTNAYLILSPRQLITSAPYAVQALNSAGFTGALLDSQLSANVPRLNGVDTFTNIVTFSNANGKFTGTFSGAATGTFSGASSGTFTGTTTGTNMGKFIGDGSGVTNFSITNLVGVVLSNASWQIVQGAAQTATAGNNYLSTNSAGVALSLQANPGVGGIVSIAGSGGAGWTIAQTGSQSIITAPLGLPAGQNWNTSLNISQPWHGLASSTNGSRLAAAYGTGFIHFSPDSGQTWTQSDAPSENWSSVACSGDGSHMVAAPNNTAAFLYTSINGGQHWTVQSTGISASVAIHSVASSSSGMNLIAATDSGIGPIYVSSNGGTNWAQVLTGQNWAGVASSADGSHLAAVGTSSGQVVTSVNSGANWTTNNVVVKTATGIASSADGKVLAVTFNTGNIYVSSDGGTTWSSRATSQAWTCITAAPDGRNLAAAYSIGFIFTSTDGGQTWLQRTNGLIPSGQSWSALATSANGSRLLGAVSTGVVYNSVAATTTGTNGSLIGSQYSTVQLQYIGNNQWMPLSFAGSITAN